MSKYYAKTKDPSYKIDLNSCNTIQDAINKLATECKSKPLNALVSGIAIYYGSTGSGLHDARIMWIKYPERIGTRKSVPFLDDGYIETKVGKGISIRNIVACIKDIKNWRWDLDSNDYKIIWECKKKIGKGFYNGDNSVTKKDIKVVDELISNYENNKSTASAKSFAYKGQIITASSRQDAIQQIIANKVTAFKNDSGLGQQIIDTVNVLESFHNVISHVAIMLDDAKKKNLCVWNVQDSVVTSKEFKYQFSVTNKNKEERTYQIFLDYGLLSKTKFAKIEGSTYIEIQGSIQNDIKKFLGI